MVPKANVLVDEFGVAKLADFGLASILDSRSSIFTSAASYKGNGPMRWQAPELLYSDLFPDVKPGTSTNSDVYAFAAVCLEVSKVLSCARQCCLLLLRYSQRKLLSLIYVTSKLFSL